MNLFASGLLPTEAYSKTICLGFELTEAPCKPSRFSSSPSIPTQHPNIFFFFHYTPAFVPASPPLRGGIAGPASVIQGGWQRRRGGTRSGVELAHGGHQAVAGELAVAVGELPRVPAEPTRGHDIVSEALHFVNPRRSNRLRVVCLEREIGEFVKRGGSGEEVMRRREDGGVVVLQWWCARGGVLREKMETARCCRIGGELRDLVAPRRR
ncbi:hypothetical protein DEO72_LG7g1310 [Vigna unguiculata]|uniref:Uncharacterized protein n=1 Tax=Vigna unguiculata TaxID=3917 RepID=A0A4D6MGV8_VIGUN|nr:hypothetical protein DEO72_LG7g1310 [Vigna unguiculata]